MSDSNRAERNIDGHGSVVSGSQRPGLTAWQKIGIAGLIAVILLAFVWLRQLQKVTTTSHDQKEMVAPTDVGQQLQRAPIIMPLAQTPLPMPAPGPLPASFLMPPQPQRHEETAAESPIMAFAGASNAASPVPAIGTSENSPPAAHVPEVPSPPNALSSRLKPTVVQPTKAALLPHPDFLITMGTIIPCTLQTAIDTQLAGYVDCVIPQDIRSTTGNVVLLDKGTKVTGEIQSGLVQGQNRVFVLWDRAETPQHAVITLSTPGSDELGRAGLPGTVNEHFWQRFGNAIMLSVLQGGLQAGTALAANSGSGSSSNSLFLNSFSNNGQELSNTALQASINIPPTLEKNQGDNVAIFVNKDLDFSDVYSLRLNRYGQ
jgi:type IV secretion system protein VirB10